jgi:hypothetical protein
MYEFIDQRVGLLSPGARFLLWAMRGWIRAASGGSCPPGALAPAFARHGVLPALPHLHLLLIALNRSATRKIAFAPLPHGTVGDDEAVLLQLCRDADTQPARARKTLALLLEEEVVENAFAALLSMIARLRDGGLSEIFLSQEGLIGSP